MDKVTRWLRSLGEASEQNRDVLTKSLARQGIQTEPFQRESPHRWGTIGPNCAQHLDEYACRPG